MQAIEQRDTRTPRTHLLQLCPVLLKLLDASLILCPLLLEKSQTFLKVSHLIRDLSWLLSEGRGREREEEGGEGEGHKGAMKGGGRRGAEEEEGVM